MSPGTLKGIEFPVRRDWAFRNSPSALAKPHAQVSQVAAISLSVWSPSFCQNEPTECEASATIVWERFGRQQEEFVQASFALCIRLSRSRHPFSSFRRGACSKRELSSGKLVGKTNIFQELQGCPYSLRIAPSKAASFQKPISTWPEDRDKFCRKIKQKPHRRTFTKVCESEMKLWDSTRVEMIDSQRSDSPFRLQFPKLRESAMHREGTLVQIFCKLSACKPFLVIFARVGRL